MKKLLLTLGTLSAVVAPVTAVVACGSTPTNHSNVIKAQSGFREDKLKSTTINPSSTREVIAKALGINWDHISNGPEGNLATYAWDASKLELAVNQHNGASDVKYVITIVPYAPVDGIVEAELYPGSLTADTLSDDGVASILITAAPNDNEFDVNNKVILKIESLLSTSKTIADVKKVELIVDGGRGIYSYTSSVVTSDANGVIAAVKEASHVISTSINIDDIRAATEGNFNSMIISNLRIVKSTDFNGANEILATIGSGIRFSSDTKYKLPFEAQVTTTSPKVGMNKLLTDGTLGTLSVPIKTSLKDAIAKLD